MGALVLLWIRAAALVGGSLALGSALFALVVLRGARERGAGAALSRALALAGAGGLVVAAAQAATFAALVAAFSDPAGWPVASVATSNAGRVALLALGAGLTVSAAARRLRRSPQRASGWAILLGAAALLPLASALVSHAMGSLEGRAGLVLLTAIHHTAASAWVGGLAAALVAAVRAEPADAAAWLRRFFPLAAASVGGLALSGIALSGVYVASPGAAIGTSYGAMVLAKAALFGALLAMAWLNHRGARGGRGAGWESRASGAAITPDDVVVLRRRLEVECGLAVVALVLAASIGSTPPAVGPGSEPATLAEIGRVLTPGWPRLTSPTLAELQAASGLGDRSVPRTPEERAWSEFGHNVSGLFVVAIGLLATLEKTGWARWARHWPLLIVALTGFVAWSLDPEGWQTGRVGFWEQLVSPEVLQHRLMLALTALFGLGEWWVRTPRGARSRWRYVFPAVCVASGMLLLTHVHEVGDPRSAFLMELLHLPLGLVLLVAGWARWLELRLPPAAGAAHGRLWGPALTFFGLLLVFYREG